jgi:PKD repeat protein
MMTCRLRCLLLCCVMGAGGSAVGQTYIFAQLTGTPINAAGWNFSGDAKITNIIGSADTEVMLTRSAKLDNGAVFFGQPINLAFCHKWIAEFDFRMYDGTAADGIAFCFLDVPPSDYVNGGGLGIPDVANGLKVCFDTWNNCVDPGDYDSVTVHQDMPKIEIRYGKGYDQVDAAGNVTYGECLPEPTLANTNGRLSFIRSPTYNRARVEYDTGRISVYVNDTLYLTDYEPNQFNFTGYMGFTASTGGFYDNQSIKNVIIYTEMPVPYAGPPQAFCPYDTIQIGGPVNPLYIYAWSPPLGLSDTTVSAPLLHLSDTTSDLALHTYYVRTAFADNPGCSSVDSVTVKVYPNPTVNFTMPAICVSDVVGQFYDSSYTQDSETLPFTYLWSFGDPNASPPGNPNSSTLQNPTHSYGAAANYPMSLTVTSSKGCVDSAEKIFTVNGADPLAAFQVLDAGGLCSNAAVQLSNNSTVNFGSIVAVEIYWGDTAGVSYMDSMPYPGKVYTHNYPDPVSSGTATYTVRMIAASGRTCQNETDQTVTIKPAPHAVFAAVPPLCDIDTAVNLSEGSELAGLPGTSYYSGKGITDGSVLNPLKAGAGADSLLFVYSGANGCSDTAYQAVWVQSLPRVRATDDTAVVDGQPLQLNAYSSDLTGDVFLWTPEEGLNNPGVANPVAVLGAGADSIRYVVVATDSLGCVGAASVKVEVFRTGPDLFVPNAFTPGRGTNATFRPIPVGIMQLLYFRVYNRLGQLVYSTSRIGEGWDGTVEGKQQATGVYVWVAEGTAYTGRVIAKKGTVVLVR